MCSCPNSLQRLYGPCTGKDVGKVGLRSLVRNTDLDFADEAFIFAETKVFAGALDSLSEKTAPLGLLVSWIKTKVQGFGDILDATVE